MPRLPPIYRAVGSRVKALRELRKLTQPQLAEAISRGPHYIGKIERGETRVQIEDLGKLATALDVTLSELLQGVTSTRVSRARGARDRAARYEMSDRTPATEDALAALMHTANALDEDDVEVLSLVATRLHAGLLARRRGAKSH